MEVTAAHTEHVNRFVGRVTKEVERGFEMRDTALAKFIENATGGDANVSYAAEWNLYPVLYAEKRALVVRGLFQQLEAEAEKPASVVLQAWLNRKAADMQMLCRGDSGSTSAASRLTEAAAAAALSTLLREVTEVLS